MKVRKKAEVLYFDNVIKTMGYKRLQMCSWKKNYFSKCFFDKIVFFKNTFISACTPIFFDIIKIEHLSFHAHFQAYKIKDVTSCLPWWSKIKPKNILLLMGKKYCRIIESDLFLSTASLLRMPTADAVCSKLTQTRPIHTIKFLSGSAAFGKN